VSCPSVWPFDQGCVSAACTAARSWTNALREGSQQAERGIGDPRLQIGTRAAFDHAVEPIHKIAGHDKRRHSAGAAKDPTRTCPMSTILIIVLLILLLGGGGGYYGYNRYGGPGLGGVLGLVLIVLLVVWLLGGVQFNHP
jgi:hypothetical protein